MAKKKQKPAGDTRVLAEKDGSRRHFTMQQLEAMGKSQDGTTYNGWKVIDPPKKPKELEGDGTKAVTKQTDKNEKSISGDAKGAAAGSGAGANGETGSDSAQGGEGNSTAD